MHLFFIDDSGSLPKGRKIVNNHFILAGLIVPEEQWFNLKTDSVQICKQFMVNGEIKWRYFGQRVGRENENNTLQHLTIIERDELRSLLLSTITKYNSIKIISAVTHLPTIYATSTFPLNAELIYKITYKPLTERFQYYLQDLSRECGSQFNGIIVCDQRNPNQDKVLSGFHNDLLKSGKSWKSQYSNLIEHVFLSPSHYSIGLQFADLVAGAISRYFEHGDKRWYQLIERSFRRSSQGANKVEGYGLVRVPKGAWKENDAESREALEPAIVTQSQRDFDHN